jgi:hypothetical protein
VFLFDFVIEKVDYDFRIGSNFDVNGKNNVGGDESQPTISKFDNFTLLIYIIGTNLEQEALDDIDEMRESNLTGSDVNIVLQTGGGEKHENFSTVQRYQMYNHSLKPYPPPQHSNSISMGDEDTLLDFIKWGISNFTAERYGLILWDHGFGISGFGKDSKIAANPFLTAPDPTLTLSEMRSIKENLSKSLNFSRPLFEFIGFDSCLMGTIEVARIFGEPVPLSKYLIASEEVVPNWGWNYKDIINSLVSNSSISGNSLGDNIIQSYVRDSKTKSQELQYHAYRDITLSVLDLTMIPD